MKKPDTLNNILDSLEERADHLPEEELAAYTAKSDFFNTIHNALISRGTKLIAGPRGSGKTHLMRFTYMGSTPILRTLQKSLIIGKRSVYVEEKKVQPRVQTRCH